jgi:hypothetical protein
VNKCFLFCFRQCRCTHFHSTSEMRYKSPPPPVRNRRSKAFSYLLRGRDYHTLLSKVSWNLYSSRVARIYHEYMSNIATDYRLDGRRIRVRLQKGATDLLGFTQLLTGMSTRHRKKSFLGVKSGRRVRLTVIPPSVSRVSRQCGMLNISRTYRPPRAVTGIALLYSLFHFLPNYYEWV